MVKNTCCASKWFIAWIHMKRNRDLTKRMHSILHLTLKNARAVLLLCQGLTSVWHGKCVKSLGTLCLSVWLSQQTGMWFGWGVFTAKSSLFCVTLKKEPWQIILGRNLRQVYTPGFVSGMKLGLFSLKEAMILQVRTHNRWSFVWFQWKSRYKFNSSALHFMMPLH